MARNYPGYCVNVCNEYRKEMLRDATNNIAYNTQYTMNNRQTKRKMGNNQKHEL